MKQLSTLVSTIDSDWKNSRWKSEVYLSWKILIPLEHRFRGYDQMQCSLKERFAALEISNSINSLESIKSLYNLLKKIKIQNYGIDLLKFRIFYFQLWFKNLENFGKNPKGEVKHMEKWPEGSAEAA